MATANQQLNQWHRDAERMEQQTRAMLRALGRHIENYPGVKAKAEALLDETKEQAAALRDCLTQHGEDASSPGRLDKRSAATKGCVSGAFIGTEHAKRTMTEVSSYNILIAAMADSATDEETRTVCEAILRREEDWWDGSGILLLPRQQSI